jgi:hypothetical protein
VSENFTAYPHAGPMPKHTAVNISTRALLLLILILMLPFVWSHARADFWGGCVDSEGRRVPDRANFYLNDIAVSRLDPSGYPIIEYNPNIVLRVSPPTRRFFYLHECGHHALGHIARNRYVPFASEQEADCWAARAMRDEGLSSQELGAIQADISTSQGDWSHLPGPRRAINLEGCLQSPTRRRESSCRTVMDQVPQQIMVTRIVPQQVPCQHCGCSPYGCGCLHPLDVIGQPMQVPETRYVQVPRTVCD